MSDYRIPPNDYRLNYEPSAAYDGLGGTDWSQVESVEIEGERFVRERVESPDRMGILPCGAIWNGKPYCGKCGAKVVGA